MVVSVLVAVRIKVSRQVGRKEGSCDQAADSSACDRALRVTRRTRVCLEEGGGEPLGLSGPACARRPRLGRVSPWTQLPRRVVEVTAERKTVSLTAGYLGRG